MISEAAVGIDNLRLTEELRRHSQSQNAVQARTEQLEAENRYLKEELHTRLNFGEIIGQSPAMGQVLQAVETVAPTNANVLIVGETGTGKELVARAVHRRSPRQGRALITVNCASIPRELLASELFGHLEGAVCDRVGRFQLAHQGTLLLAEVGESPLELQSKLLRVLQHGELERVGDERTLTVDVRVIASTNRDRPAGGRGRPVSRGSVIPVMCAPDRGGAVTQAP